MSRFSFLDFLRKPDEVAHEKQPASSVSIPPRLEIIQREDVENAFLAGSLSAMTGFGLLSLGEEPGRVAYACGLVFTATTSVIYGSRIVIRALPEAALSFTQMRASVAMPLGLTNTHTGAVLRHKSTDKAPETEAEAWRQTLRRFLLAAKWEDSFAVRDLAFAKYNEHGELTRERYMTDTAWRLFVSVLKSNGVLVTNRHGTTYADRWDYGRATHYIRHGALSLPSDLKGKIRACPEIRLY